MKLKGLKSNNKDKSNLTEEAGNAFKPKFSIKSIFGFSKESGKSNANQQRGLQVKLPGGDGFVPLGAWQYHKVYSDSLGKHLVIIVDEAAELLQAEGGRSAEAKEIAALQAEVETCLKSTTQLGRSACISVVIATQRNDASIIPGVIQNNPLSVDTKIKVLRPVNKQRDLDIRNASITDKNKDMLNDFANQFGIDYDKNNGIVFHSEMDMKDFYSRMQIDADKYDEENKSLVLKV